MSKWERAKSALSDPDRDRAEAAESVFSIGEHTIHIFTNIREERFIDTPSMQKIAQFVADRPDHDIVKFLEDYALFCIGYGDPAFTLTLKGGSVPTSSVPKRMGRAIELDKWTDDLSHDAANRDIEHSEAKAIMERLLLKRPSVADELAFPTMNMSPWAAWVTWDLDSDGEEDPFEKFKGDADSIRISLGLEAETPGVPILTIAYFDHAVTALYRPTIADAGVYPWFFPPPPQYNDHGITRPWRGWEGKRTGGRDFKAIPMPEALHERITMDALRDLDVHLGHRGVP